MCIINDFKSRLKVIAVTEAVGSNFFSTSLSNLYSFV